MFTVLQTYHAIFLSQKRVGMLDLWHHLPPVIEDTLISCPLIISSEGDESYTNVIRPPSSRRFTLAFVLVYF